MAVEVEDKEQKRCDKARERFLAYLWESYTFKTETLFYQQALIAARQLLLPSIKQPFKTLKPLFKKQIRRATRRRGTPKVFDIEKERMIVGINDVLRGMENTYVEGVLDEMLRERDTTLGIVSRKLTILNNVRWSYL